MERSRHCELVGWHVREAEHAPAQRSQLRLRRLMKVEREPNDILHAANVSVRRSIQSRSDQAERLTIREPTVFSEQSSSFASSTCTCALLPR